MYENSREPFYINLSYRPSRIENNSWLLDRTVALKQNFDGHASKLASSFYFPYTCGPKQMHASYDGNHRPTPSSSSSTSSTYSSNYDRPKLVVDGDLISSTHPPLHVNDLRQRYEYKTVVGIVKPMVHQRSSAQLSMKNKVDKVQETPIKNTYEYNSLQSLNSSPTHTSPLSSTTSSSSVIYRTRPTPSHTNTNGPPPIAPRRYSSISTNKHTSSHRSSRTTSTSSSVVGINELSSRISSDENEQQN